MSEWLPGTWVPKGPPVVNLFTNPNFVAGSGAVELRRNLFPDPLATGTAAFTWLGSSGATATLGTIASGLSGGPATAVRGTLTGAATTWRRIRNAASIPVSAGQTWTFSEWIRSSRDIRLSARIQWLNSSNNQISETSYVDKQSGVNTWDRYSVTATAPSGAVAANLYADVVSSQAGEVGDTLDTTGWLMELSAAPGPFFAPGIPSPDPDLTASWTGAANASDSVLTGVPVAGVPSIPGRCLAIWSSKYGGSMRLIAARASNDTFVFTSVPGAALGGTGGTFIATRRQDAVISSPISRALWIAQPEQSIPIVNETAAHEYRLQFTTLTSNGGMRFYHGGAQGSGDVYWTLGGLFEGVYDGPAFSGNTPSTDEVVYAWTGTPDASPSTRQEMEAVMATIYGTLTDFGLQSLAPYRPVLTFIPSGPGVNGRRLFASTPIKATVAQDGTWAVLLEPTVGVTPDVWYDVSIEHLNPGGEYTHYDFLGYKLRVIPPGGPIGEMPGVPLGPDTVLVSLAAPPPGYKGWYLNAPGPGNPPGDPDDPASSGTGILEIVS